MSCGWQHLGWLPGVSSQVVLAQAGLEYPGPLTVGATRTSRTTVGQQLAYYLQVFWSRACSSVEPDGDLPRDRSDKFLGSWHRQSFTEG